MYVGGLHVDDSYMRLTRTIDLTGVAAAEAPTLAAQLSFDVEPDFDHVIVEAHTVGQDNWTTLPEAGRTDHDGGPRRVRGRLPARGARVPAATT